MSIKLKAGVIGATGMVGQRFVSLLENHPYFEVALVAASKASAGKTYEEAVSGRWAMTTEIPASIKKLVVRDASNINEISEAVDFVFCAVDMPKDQVLKLEEDYARSETPVISNNSAARNIPDVPMIIPEINNSHFEVLASQKKRLNTSRGFIVVKPNCSIQSYVPAIHPLLDFRPVKMVACTYQAISGAGKTFENWPEMIDNVIPYIGGEEEKSEKEPLKIWGSVKNGAILPADKPVITSQCIRVPVSDGHLAAVHVSFEKKPSMEEILSRWKNFSGRPQELSLPSAPKPFLTYFPDQSRPQTALDRDIGGGMGVSIGRLREDTLFDFKFVCLSHNTIRGAAGGGVLIAELLYKDGFFSAK